MLLVKCKTFGFCPKFIYVIFGIWMGMTLYVKKLGNNAIYKRILERNVFDKKVKNIKRTIRSNVNTIDYLIIKKSIFRYVKRSEQYIFMTHEKELTKLNKKLKQSHYA